MNWATRTRNKVHKITPVVEGIMAMGYCGNCRTVAKVLGCSPKSVERIRMQLKSSAHIFLSPETLRGMR
jgi:hypothetical protein